MAQRITEPQLPACRINAFALCALTLLFIITSAEAGAYEVRNFTGTIGDSRVHLSLQSYQVTRSGRRERDVVEASYYADARRIPIPLSGTYTADGRITLCERPPELRQGRTLGQAAPHPAECPITLSVTQAQATGERRSGRSVQRITLKQVGQIERMEGGDTLLTGTIEIPMWYHTATHLYLGIYESTEKCPLVMRRLRLINVATGRREVEIPLDEDTCDAGMLMTTIYANVFQSSKPHHVKVGFDGGHHGHEEDIDIRPRARRH